MLEIMDVFLNLNKVIHIDIYFKYIEFLKTFEESNDRFEIIKLFLRNYYQLRLR